MAKEKVEEEVLEIDLEELEDLEEIAIVDEEDLDDDAVLGDPAEEDAEDDEEVVAAATALRRAEGEEDDEDVPDADDVEASLDTILKERLVVEDEVEDEGVIEVDDRGDGGERILPKQSDEFVCASCFLVKNTNQRADAKKNLCRDCV